MSDIIANLTPEIRRSQTPPRSPGHRVPSTGSASQPASARQADQRGGTVRTPIQRAYPEARGAAQRDAPNDYNFLLQRNFIAQNTLTVQRRVRTVASENGVRRVYPLPGERMVADVENGGHLEIRIQSEAISGNEDLFFTGSCSVEVTPIGDERADGAEDDVTDLTLPGFNNGVGWFMQNLQSGNWEQVFGALQRRRRKNCVLGLKVFGDPSYTPITVTTGYEISWFDERYFPGAQMPVPVYAANPTINPSAALRGYLSLFPGERRSYARGSIASCTINFRAGGGEGFIITSKQVGPLSHSSVDYDFPPPSQQTV